MSAVLVPSATVDELFVERRLRPYLSDLLAEERAAWARESAPWDDSLSELDWFLDGGKALRPRFCYWGHEIGGRDRSDDQLVAACAALELLHAFALIHDDLMDDSASRRGRPALHHCIAAEHRRRGWAGDPDQYGLAGALLTGDLAFALASRLAAGLPPAAQRIWHRMVIELTCGQHLDLAGTARRDRTPGLASVVARLKSGRYTVSGPIQLGAATATDVALGPEIVRFGELVGKAFQWCDDLLGVFGDPRLTGKPVGDDLRSGKPTLLLAMACRRASAHDRVTLERVGARDLTDAELTELTAVIERSGAREWLERRIDRNLRITTDLIHSIDAPAPARDALAALAAEAGRRRA
jgi:geranylgeranyl diphosphate synthase type I